MTHIHRPLFGVMEQVAAHKDGIRDLINAGLSNAISKRYPDKTEHGYFATGSNGETYIRCDLTRHTDKQGRSQIIWKDQWGSKVYAEMHDLLDNPEKILSAVPPNAAYHHLRNFAWYLEQRTWSKYALANHRRINTWLMMKPHDLRLLSATIIHDQENESPWLTLSDVASFMEQDCNVHARHISRRATKIAKSLIEFSEYSTLLPGIELPSGHRIEAQGHNPRGMLYFNISGHLDDGLHYQHTQNHIILGKTLPHTVVQTLPGRRLKEVLDLPWYKNEIIAEASVESDRLHLHLADPNDKSATGIIIGQVLPKNARPGTDLGWEKD